MLDRFGPGRTVLAAAGTVVAALTALAPAAAAASPPPAVHPAAIGGAQLAGRGVIVSYPAGPAANRVPKLPAPPTWGWPGGTATR